MDKTQFSNKYIEITSERFLLKTLQFGEATETYLDWFSEKNIGEFIVAARSEQSIESLNEFIKEKFAATDCLFFGIYEKGGGAHIGNVKYEPISIEHSSSVMGIMLGDLNWRGKGVAGEIIQASFDYFKENFELKKMLLGVEVENQPAIRAYEKLGFVKIESSPLINAQDNAFIMEKKQ